MASAMTMTGMKGAELLAPAGDFDTALAAFAAGADAVYCGLADFSARAFAKNLSFEDLKRLLAYARQDGAPRRRVYVTFNTLLDEDQLDAAGETLAQLDAIGPDGVIVQDLGVARLCRTHFPRLELHASTQLVAHNLEGVLELKDLGFRRVVLARELSLEEVASIAKRCGAARPAADGRPELELECFIHGALCYSLSGLCLFGALEKGRSGNRGTCPYCCRQGFPSRDARGTAFYPFSMKDLRLGEDARRLVEAGVSSLKIEGRMKTPLYVASVTRYYRQILGGEMPQGVRAKVTPADLETVFSRRTTELYFNGRPGSGTVDSPVDPESLGHLGTAVGTVKKVTKDRDGLAWLRFHTARGLEKHDGLQFEATDGDGRHLGLGIVEMRQAISRRPVFEVNAGVDVEILLPEKDGEPSPWAALRPGMKIYCSMSNAVRRMFPAPSFRPSDYAGTCAVDLALALSAQEVCVTATSADGAFAPVSLARCGAYPAAQNPTKTFGAIEKAFSKLGGTDYRLGRLTLDDPDRTFVPMRDLNDLRRDLVEKLDAARIAARQAKLDALADARAELSSDAAPAPSVPARTLKIRLGQKIPAGDWDELVVAVDFSGDDAEAALDELKAAAGAATPIRVALPLYTAEPDFNRMRTAVKRLLRAGWTRWECADLATLRLLRLLGVTDITADWSLYAFNGEALALLAARGVTRFVASPENGRENLQFLAESGRPVAFLEQQSTPLFISLTRPETGADDPEGLRVFLRGGLWVTTRPAPRTFSVPSGAPRRLDLSWDPT